MVCSSPSSIIQHMAPKKDKAPPPSSKPAKSGGGKQKKKKWSKGKQKEKVNNMVLFDQATYDKLLSEAPKYKLITPSILSDRMRINGSLARKAIRELMARGSIRIQAKYLTTIFVGLSLHTHRTSAVMISSIALAFEEDDIFGARSNMGVSTISIAILLLEEFDVEVMGGGASGNGYQL
ncbi:hypothetical protein GOBAR_AA32811 [Gossypium barbadense]|uniref:40S ribosomal protein S25 n=1 Tax=Gossypium barbadense TaxID=3634 RepID=A0A2P5W9X5_GOSBA|nr:hypothetical protein GOBAR_AA32811 [Gossypium barbadense]